MGKSFMGMPEHEAREMLLKYSRHEELEGCAAAMHKAMKASMESFEPVDPMTVAYAGKRLRDLGVVLDG